MSEKIALITGITGQDGSYLTDFLLSIGYTVHGVVRRTSSLDRWRLEGHYRNSEIYNRRLFLHYADLSDVTTLRRLLTKVAPNELYHLAGQSHVGLSFDMPESTAELTALSTLRLLEITRDMSDPPKFFHASSSEIFGRPVVGPQDETFPHNPVTPYGVAKSFATHMTALYRNSFGLFACNGIAYNHESPRRGDNFVTRKICAGAAAIKSGKQKQLILGDTSAQRDWGFAPDYVRAMWLTLQNKEPDDYIFASGELHCVQDVIDIAFNYVGLSPNEHISNDSKFIRPSEPCNLVGDPRKAEKILGWSRTLSFDQMIIQMVEAELTALSLEENQY
jgi:GDPmannose 4,6-dehydratase